MSTKSAIKMINIQKSYSVHIVLFIPLGLIWSTLVLFGPFCPLQSYSGHSVYSTYFSSTQSTSSCSIHSIYFSPIQSTLFLFGPLWSYSVQFGPNLDYIQFLKLLVFSHCIIILKTQKGLQFEPSNSNYIYQMPLTSPTMPLSI